MQDAAFYQKLHDTNLAYQKNNWLMDELESIKRFNAQTILEVGCGNGRFLELAAKHFKTVHGCDWARSPRIDGIVRENPQVNFHAVDLCESVPHCSVELVVSADVMEHIPPASLLTALRRIDGLAPKQFHKVACYDDGLCHLSIMNPLQWLQTLQQIDAHYVLERTEKRLGIAGKELAIFTKGRP
jgi:2-polyprenyl-3-methyl-5-hydroxy-6-metoxy-1,4-benzoquinol methylase